MLAGAKSPVRMEVRFADGELSRLASDPSFTGHWDRTIVKAFRKRIQMICDAPDERVFRSAKSVHFEKLGGNRSHQHSMKLNEQWRLVIELEGQGQRKVVTVVGIEDYH